MRYRILDENGDYVLGLRRNAFHTDKEAVAQAIKTRLKLLTNEWWENTQDGLPLFEQILGVFGGEDYLNGIDLIVQERILSTPNVEEIKDYQREFDRKNRKYTFTATVKTLLGNIEIGMEEVM